MQGKKKQVIDGKIECSKCGAWKPLDDFYKNNRTSTGRTPSCRSCNGQKRPRGEFGRNPIQPVDGQFQCNLCHAWKPLERFEKKSDCAFGVSRRCLDCGIRRTQDFASRSPFNFLRHIAGSLRRAAGQRSKRSHKDFSREMLRDPHKLLEIYEQQNGLCALTGVPLTYQLGERRCWTNISIDRVEASRGYEHGNVRLVCLAANLMRNDMTDSELLSWAEKIVNHKRE